MERRPRIRLLTRGDDLGAFEAGNRAIVDAYQHGILRNASLIAPAPNVHHAVRLVKQVPRLCLGLHITLTSEWDAPRWGPISPAETVPSLVNSDGCFFRTTMELFERGINVDEAVREVKAQIQFARSLGLDICYLDEHMVPGWIFDPDDTLRTPLSSAFKAIAQEEGLIWYGDIVAPSEQLPASRELPEILRQLQPGTHLLITHPAYDDAETRQVVGSGHMQPGSLARMRARDFQLLREPEIMRVIAERQIQLVRYDEV